MTAGDLIRSICDQNLAVYRASPIRLREDVGQEAEIAHDYRGRIVYELLQNADDAMADNPGTRDAILVRLTDTDLWVGNSGRPLDEDDVRGLCGIGASSKGGAVNRKRAWIGHKGMGFKSVLEITDAPEVISETFAFRLGRHLAVEPVTALMREIGEPAPARVPSMRFPATLDRLPPEWDEAQAAGLRTMFRFPLRADLSAAQRSKLADRLIDLPVTAILFLKHLERIDVEVDTAERSDTFRWVIARAVDDEGEWSPVSGLSRTGLYRVEVDADHSEHRAFLVAHDDDLEIGEHRGGLDEYAWSGVELSEVSVAVQLVDDRPVAVDQNARVLHVFLPTGESCPYPIVINGAFSADLSRQEVRVSPDPDDYNGWLLSEAARVFASRLVPALLGLGAGDVDVLGLLEREAAEPGDEAPTRTGQVLVEAMRVALAHAAVVPTQLGSRIPVSGAVVPPLVDDGEAGSMFRSLLADDASVDGLAFPVPQLCAGSAAFVLADHGATALDPSQAPSLLAGADLTDVDLELHESELVWVDPVLRTLERIWSGLPPYHRDAFEAAVRDAELFPTDGDSPAEIRRVAVADRDCFYPPRALSGAIPLEGLCFLSRDLCWGDLVPKQRQDLLHTELAVWQALFGVREFKFPDVMRSSVLPALTLPDEGGRPEEWNSLRRPEVVAAVCQLSGRTPNPSAPLPYERLGPNRALFNLSRLPVPCRTDESGELTWQPAYRVYFGSDWIGDSSVELVVDAISSTGAQPPDVPFLAGPDLLVPLLERYEHLRRTTEEDAGEDDDEVDIDEDEEQALDTDHRERWISFLTWLGVNHALRPVHFSDVEDRQSGWLTTKDLGRPTGWAFRTLDTQVWTSYVARVRADPRLARAASDATPYFYELHDLEFLAEVLGAVADDPECVTAKALLVHLVENWSQLQRFSKVTVAAVPSDRVPSMRSKPPRAQDDELLGLSDNLWLHRLRRRQFLPTTHGPKSPSATWGRTRELDRRFTSRRGKLDAGQLLPILDIDGELAVKARPICSLLGVRDEITSSSFGPDDARTVLDRLAALFGHGASDTPREPDRAAVREVIRPTYRNLVELLPGADADERFPAGVLAGSPLLEDDGRGSYRFSPSDQALWAERNGTRERLGNPPELWTFVLDASPGPRLPLTRLFDVRVLEEQLHWEPEPGDDALDDLEIASFRAGLQELAPFILARLSADRSTETQQARDASLLRRVLASLTPVQELFVGCTLDDRPLAGRTERSAFVEVGPDLATTRAFVKWDEVGWPPSADGAEALATAFAEAFGASHFEAFLALVRAPDEAARLRLLTLAGATPDVEAFAAAMAGDDEPPLDDEPKSDDDLALPKEAAGDAEEKPAERPEAGGAVGPVVMTPLYAAGDLLIGATPISVTGDERSNGDRDPERRSAARPGGGGGATTGYGGRTDLSALDALGMFVAMTYEVNRLGSDGVTAARVFDPGCKADQPDACVFDISSPALIALAQQHSEPFRQATAQLAAHGVNQEHPGCDILTLRPGMAQPIDRLIELKSSGQHARTQVMTWNEWKTAQNDQLRSHFYLYLVANLRSDLPDARPFLRAVRDPYATIRAQEQVEHSVTRRVMLRVAEFDQAEHLELGVVDHDHDTG